MTASIAVRPAPPADRLASVPSGHVLVFRDGEWLTIPPSAKHEDERFWLPETDCVGG